MGAIAVVLQVGILLLSLAMLFALQYIPNRHQNQLKLRTKNRTSLQANRHITNCCKLLSRANNKSSSNDTSLAKAALSEAETAITLAPRDPTVLILKARALDLLGHKPAALRSLDLALTSPRVTSLPDKDRADALVRRAELKVVVNVRRRVDSAVEDLKEALRLLGGADHDWALCLLGRCYEWKGMRDDANWAFQEALRARPDSVAARDGLTRLEC